MHNPKNTQRSCNKLFASNLSASTNNRDIVRIFCGFTLLGYSIRPYSAIILRNQYTNTINALLTFASPEEASMARSTLNFKMINKREMLLSPYDPAIVHNKKTLIFVKGFAADDINKRIHDFFAKFGEIFCCKHFQDSQGYFKGYGFVQYTNEEIVKSLLAHYRLLEYRNRYLELHPFIFKDSESEEGYTNIYVKNLPPNVTTQEALSKIFNIFGNIRSIKIQQHRLFNQIGYFGLVCFETHEQAKNAVDKLNGLNCNGSVLYVARALSKEDRKRQLQRNYNEYRTEIKRRGLFLRTLRRRPLQQEEIEEELKNYDIESILINKIYTSQGPIDGFTAKVLFRNEEEAKRALREHEGTESYTLEELKFSEEYKEGINTIYEDNNRSLGREFGVMERRRVEPDERTLQTNFLSIGPSINTERGYPLLRQVDMDEEHSNSGSSNRSASPEY